MKKRGFRLPSLATLIFAVTMFVMLVPFVDTGGAAAFGAGIVLSSYLPMPVGILGLNNTSNISARDSFIQAKKMFFKAFINNFKDDQLLMDASGRKVGQTAGEKCAAFVEGFKLSQSEIRLEVQLNALQNVFTFGVTPNQANSNNVQFNTERRLPLSDSICVNEYAIFVGLPPGDGATPANTNWLLRTYGNIVDFTAASALALDSTFYSHGNFIIKCNNDIIMPYRGLSNHWYKPQTQQTAALGAASPGDQIRGAEDGAITDEPNVVVIGQKNYVPQIELPTALTSVDAGTRAVLIMKGVYAQNSTVIS